MQKDKFGSIKYSDNNVDDKEIQTIIYPNKHMQRVRNPIACTRTICIIWQESAVNYVARRALVRNQKRLPSVISDLRSRNCLSLLTQGKSKRANTRRRAKFNKLFTISHVDTRHNCWRDDVLPQYRGQARAVDKSGSSALCRLH